jgi:hypothetical protein
MKQEMSKAERKPKQRAWKSKVERRIGNIEYRNWKRKSPGRIVAVLGLKDSNFCDQGETRQHCAKSVRRATLTDTCSLL